MMTRTAINLISREYRIDSNANLSSDILEALERIDEFGPYGYRPNLIGSILFCIVFGLLAIILTFQNVKGKSYWFLFTLGFGSWCECVGNGLRIYGHFYPNKEDPYIAQQCILVLTPALFAAAHYSILTKMCQMYGSNLIDPFKPSWLIPMFVTLDLGSLAIQGAGSGLAATAEIDNHSVDDINNQGDIVLAGLAIQLAGYLTFNTLFILFIKRALVEKQKGRANWFTFRQKVFFSAVFISALLVLGRSAFRTAEMALGWVGEVATREWYYLVFDASFVALAVLIITVISPVHFLQEVERSRKETIKVERQNDLESQTEMARMSDSFEHLKDPASGTR